MPPIPDPPVSHEAAFIAAQFAETDGLSQTPNRFSREMGGVCHWIEVVVFAEHVSRCLFLVLWTIPVKKGRKDEGARPLMNHLFLVIRDS